MEKKLKVLLPVDLMDRDIALQEIRRAMVYLKPQPVEMHFMSIIPKKPVSLLGNTLPSKELQGALEVLGEELQGVVREALPLLSEFIIKTCEGSIYKEILKYSEEIEPALIVMPSHSHSKVENILIGSVTSKVVEKANCSVLVVR